MRSTPVALNLISRAQQGSQLQNVTPHLVDPVSAFTMGVTNFRTAHDLIMRAGSTFNDTGILQPVGTALLVVSGPTAEQELEKWSPILSCHIEDQWVSRKPNADIQVVQPPAALAVPQLRVSPGLDGTAGFWDADGQEQARIKQQTLAYITVVQGKEASTRSKVVVKYTLEDISSAMLFEALNGYSVVFSGAIFKKTVPKLFGHNILRTDFTFMKVGNLDALMKSEEKDGVVNVLC